jgi:hypothetical protein
MLQGSLGPLWIYLMKLMISLMAFISLFSDVLSVHAPIKAIHTKKNPAPWITRSIRDEMDSWNK